MGSKKQKKRHRKQGVTPPPRDSRSTRWIVIPTLVIVVVVAAIWWSRDDGRVETTLGDRTTDGVPTEALNSPEAARWLIGSWQRTDANYVIEIHQVDGFGVVDAAYLNPNPIHVSQARASDAEGALDLFIELTDVGYPGATYRLRYSPEHDAMVGLYYQPTAGQTFEVAFQRTR